MLRELRTEIAEACAEMADKNGELPLEQQVRRCELPRTGCEVRFRESVHAFSLRFTTSMI